MKHKYNFLLVDTYYPQVLSTFYSKDKAILSAKPYNLLNKKIAELKFGTSDFYSSNLKALGHTAQDIILNDDILMKKYFTEVLKEKNLHQQFLPNFFLKVFPAPVVNLINQIKIYRTLSKIVKKNKPDVLYIHNLSLLITPLLKRLKKHCRLIVGQIASPLPPDFFISGYDLIFTSFPHFVTKLKSKGINSEYLKLGFEPSILKNFKNQKRKYDVVFIGGFTRHHKDGNDLLEKLAQEIKVDFWGYGEENLNNNSPILRHFHKDRIFGKDMFSVLNQTKIFINRHINTASEYANNMKLYEATGMGALLLTDQKKNLSDIFLQGKEVVSYKDTKDLIKKTKYYLKHPAKARKIALAGQQKTLISHNYLNRMKEMVSLLEKYL